MQIALYSFAWLLPLLLTLIGRKFEWKSEYYLLSTMTPGVLVFNDLQDVFTFSETANEGLGLLAWLTVGLIYRFILVKAFNLKTPQQA